MRSLWLEEALRGEEAAPMLDGSERADVCIVGGGFTGLWTAIRLKEDPSIDVVLIERDVCGGGAGGRNGGFVLSWWAKFHSLLKLATTEDALWLARSSADAIGQMASSAPNTASTRGSARRVPRLDRVRHGDGSPWGA